MDYGLEDRDESVTVDTGSKGSGRYSRGKDGDTSDGDMRAEYRG